MNEIKVPVTVISDEGVFEGNLGGDDTIRPKWRAEVDVGEGIWHTNALRFDTEAEALDYASDLGVRWTLVKRVRAVPDSTPLREPVQS